MHVVPKAKVAAALAQVAKESAPAPVPADEEKTNLEAQWEEEEASTTVDQGGVAERIRDLNLDAPIPRHTGATGTGTGSLVEEPTVDDGKSPDISPLPAGAARMVVTAGVDEGKLFDIDGGKAFSVGRALDNDIVLSDIAVSRRHFDLRFEADAWVIVDHGSGNGTVVNGNLEDNPFMLANGDAIEIGNTTFRFEQHALPAHRASATAPETFDVDMDDEEPSTVAGKKFDTTPSPHVPAPRPKTLPPPMPARTRSTTQPPQPFSLPPAPVPGMGPIPASRQQMTALSPPGTQPSSISTAPLGSRSSNPSVNGIPMNSGPQQHARVSASMSAAITNAPVGSNPMTAMHGQPHMMSALGTPHAMSAISAPATAPTLLGDPRTGPSGIGHVHTTIPGQGAPGPAPAPQLFYPQATEIPPHSIHMLVVQAQNGRRNDGSTSHVPPQPFVAVQMAPRFGGPKLSRRTKIGIALGAITLFATITTIAIARSGSKHDDKTATPTTQPPKVASKPGPAPTPPPAPTTAPTPPAPAPTPPPPAPTPKVATGAPTPAPKPPSATPTPPPTVVAVHHDPKPEPKPDPKPEPKSTARRDDGDGDKSGAHATSLGTTSASSPRVAVTEDAKDKADKLYRDKHFVDAANLLTSAARSADADTAKDYKLRASRYAALARFYNQGMAPGADPEDAFEALRSALTFDQNVGGEFQSDITDHIRKVVARASATFFAGHELEKAHTAVQTAEQLGVTSETIKSVKSKLELEAQSLYTSAKGDGFSTPSGKDKLRKIKSIVDASSQWFQKANQALLGQS